MGLEDAGVQQATCSENASAVSVRLGYQMSTGSCASVVSFISGASDVGPKCFVPGTLLKMRNKLWAPVEEIHEGQWALSYERLPVQVKRAKKCTHDDVILTKLVCPSVT